jgi:hypothetical protein
MIPKTVPLTGRHRICLAAASDDPVVRAAQFVLISQASLRETDYSHFWVPKYLGSIIELTIWGPIVECFPETVGLGRHPTMKTRQRIRLR